MIRLNPRTIEDTKFGSLVGKKAVFDISPLRPATNLSIASRMFDVICDRAEKQPGICLVVVTASRDAAVAIVARNTKSATKHSERGNRE